MATAVARARQYGAAARRGHWRSCAGAVLVVVPATTLVAVLLGRLVLDGETVVPTAFIAAIAADVAAIATALAWAARLTIENGQLRAELARSTTMVRQADRLASLGLLTAGLVHEVRNPLVALRTFAQLLPQRWEDREFRREFSEVVLSEIDRTGALIDDLLQFARRHAAPGEHASLIEIVGAILPLLRVQAEHKSIALEFDGRADTPGVLADAAQLRQVIMNLVLNAIESTPSGGTISVSCGRVDAAYGIHAFVRVSDSGPGIEAEHLGRVFDPFFTTRREGTGMGLAVTREIVHAHGGTIEVQSAVGGGASFVVALPALESSASDGARPAAL